RKRLPLAFAPNTITAIWREYATKIDGIAAVSPVTASTAPLATARRRTAPETAPMQAPRASAMVAAPADSTALRIPVSASKAVAALARRTHDRRARFGERLHARPRPRLGVRDPAGDHGPGAGATRVLVEHRDEVTEDRVEAQTFAFEVVEDDDGVPARSTEKIRDGTRVAECVDRSVERDDRDPGTGTAGERADERGERVGRGSRAAPRRGHHRPDQHTRRLAGRDADEALRRRRHSRDRQLDVRLRTEIASVRRLRY